MMPGELGYLSRKRFQFSSGSPVVKIASRSSRPNNRQPPKPRRSQAHVSRRGHDQRVEPHHVRQRTRGGGGGLSVVGGLLVMQGGSPIPDVRRGRGQCEAIQAEREIILRLRDSARPPTLVPVAEGR